MAVLTVSPALRERLGDEAVEDFVRLLSALEKDTSERAVALVEERFARRVSESEARLDGRITNEVGRLRVDMASFKTEIIKWMFLFWVGQLVIIAGLIKFLK